MSTSGTGNFIGSGLWPSSGTSTNRCTRFSFLRNVSFFLSCGKTLKEANSCPPGSLRHNRTDRKRYDGDYEKFRRTTTTSKLLQTSAQACAVCVAPSIRDDRTTRFSSNVIRRRFSRPRASRRRPAMFGSPSMRSPLTILNWREGESLVDHGGCKKRKISLQGTFLLLKQ